MVFRTAMNQAATLPNSSPSTGAPRSLALVPSRTAQGHQRRVRLDGRRLCRGSEPFRVRGVTYGPFAPGSDGTQFPSSERVRDDFEQMASAGINALRDYHVPPPWLLDAADQQGVSILIDIPRQKHLCFLDSDEACREARQVVQRAAERGRRHSCVLAYSIGNEIPPDVVRWHGRQKVERFLAELCDVARQSDPDSLVTYANFPPTEYL